MPIVHATRTLRNDCCCGDEILSCTDLQLTYHQRKCKGNCNWKKKGGTDCILKNKSRKNNIGFWFCPSWVRALKIAPNSEIKLPYFFSFLDISCRLKVSNFRNFYRCFFSACTLNINIIIIIIEKLPIVFVVFFTSETTCIMLIKCQIVGTSFEIPITNRQNFECEHIFLPPPPLLLMKHTPV